MKINMELLKQASHNIQKQAFVAAGDPMMTGDPAAAGGDPATAGGAPADPAAGGAPADPAAAGGAPPAGPDPMMAIQSMVQQAVQQAMATQGGGAAGGAGGAAGGIKPKIDVNVELMQIKKLLARIVDTMGIPVPASDMVATPDDLNQMAQQQQAGGGGAAPPAGAIPPVQPMKAAESPWEQGSAFQYNEEQAINNHSSLGEKAAAFLLRKKVK